MRAWITSMTGLIALIGAIVGALSYFATSEELDAVADSVKQNSVQLNYQSTLRQYEFLLKQPKSPEATQRLQETQKRLKYYECVLFKQCK
jgi:hypothetical protein